MKDTEIKKLLKAEKTRQKKVVNLIASENYVSSDVLKALGSELTNKYAEGYPGKRYYGGNEYVDQIETLCKERALKLFGLDAGSVGTQARKWHVNVQPLSGSPANLAVFLGLVPPGGKIMGMSLAHGGHLTHGQKVSITGKMWTPVHFGVDQKTELIDYAALKAQAIAEKPAIIVAGFTAYPRIVDFKQFRAVADACGAILMVDMSHFAGLVAGAVYPSPFAYADVVTTTTHKTLRGPRAALIFVRKDKSGLNPKGESVSFADLIDKAVFPGLQGGPHLNQIAAVAVALKEAATPAFQKYAAQVVQNAKALANELSSLGWRVISGGTDSHLVLIDTWMGGKKGGADGKMGGITGEEASERLEKAGIIVNKNAIPFDTRPPMDPSGIRLGSAAETTRGKKEKDFRALAQKIDKILRK
ncbi:MAG: serine hydroxymethyltransferase [Patescibacteria group bacterium]